MIHLGQKKSKFVLDFGKLVILKSLRNFKRRNKGNFMLKSNSNKIIWICGGGEQHYLVFIKI